MICQPNYMLLLRLVLGCFLSFKKLQNDDNDDDDTDNTTRDRCVLTSMNLKRLDPALIWSCPFTFWML